MKFTKWDPEWIYESPCNTSEICWQLRTIFENSKLRGVLEAYPVNENPGDEDLMFCVDCRKFNPKIGFVILGYEHEYRRNNGYISVEDATLAAHKMIGKYISMLEGRILFRSKQFITKNDPLSIRFRVFTRDGFRCRYCGRGSDQTTLEIDHIVPKSKGGLDDETNYITSCKECNLGKRDVLILAHKKKLAIRDEGQIPSFIALPNKGND